MLNICLLPRFNMFLDSCLLFLGLRTCCFAGLPPLPAYGGWFHTNKQGPFSKDDLAHPKA